MVPTRIRFLITTLLGIVGQKSDSVGGGGGGEEGGGGGGGGGELMHPIDSLRKEYDFPSLLSFRQIYSV